MSPMDRVADKREQETAQWEAVKTFAKNVGHYIMQISPRRYQIIGPGSSHARIRTSSGHFHCIPSGDVKFTGTYEECQKWWGENLPPIPTELTGE